MIQTAFRRTPGFPGVPDEAVSGLSRTSPATSRALRSIDLTFSFSMFIALLYNDRFWRIVLDNSPTSTAGDWLVIGAAFLFITLWLSLFFHLTGVKYLLKPLLIVVLLISTLTNYFSANYGVVIDSSMIKSIVETDAHEAMELISAKFLISLLVYFAIPAMAIAWVPVRWQPIKKEIAQRVVVYLITVALMGGLFVICNKAFTFLFRQHPQLRSLVTPTYPIHAAIKFFRRRNSEPVVVKKIGTDARQAIEFKQRLKKTLFVLVVGETARAENFSLNGYSRITNPELSKLNILNFRNTYSCGTSTAESLPCMFSHLSRRDYRRSGADQYENLLDVLEHSGIRSLWIDNQSGCKGICDRSDHLATSALEDPNLCRDGECYDEILLQGLRSRVFNDTNQTPRDQLVILHQQGSHGPAFYKRAPERFRKFIPECHSVNLQECSRQEVINSYDNTILYTDYVLGRLIELLKMHQSEYDIALYYISDHGESLGENGIYLHGMPSLFAPEQQTHVPAVLWMSNGFRSDNNISTQCMKRRLNDDYSHDNIFHTVLGAFGIESVLYHKVEDLLSACRSADSQPPASAVDHTWPKVVDSGATLAR